MMPLVASKVSAKVVLPEEKKKNKQFSYFLYKRSQLKSDASLTVVNMCKNTKVSYIFGVFLQAGNEIGFFSTHSCFVVVSVVKISSGETKTIRHVLALTSVFYSNGLLSRKRLLKISSAKKKPHVQKDQEL